MKPEENSCPDDEGVNVSSNECQDADPEPLPAIPKSVTSTWMRNTGIFMCAIFGAAQIGISAEKSRVHLSWSQLSPLPVSAGVGGCFAGVSGEALLVAGGSNFPGKKIWEGGSKVWHDTVYVLTSPTGEWQRAGKLPRPVAYGVSVTSSQGLVCIGGADGSRHYADVWSLSWADGKLRIETLPSLPSPLAYAAGTAIGNVIYVIGGLDAPASQEMNEKFFALDLSETKPVWRELEPCSGKPRMLAVVGVVDGSFYFAGGVTFEAVNGKTQRVYLQDAWRYRPHQGWQQLPDLPAGCSAGASPAPVFASTLFLFGGDDGSLAGFQPMEKHPGFSKRVQAYDAASETWALQHEAPFPNATVQTAFWQGRYIFAGGEPRPGVRSSQVWALNFMNR